MFQIVCVLALGVPEVLQELELLRGVPPNVQLSCEPWGHLDHANIDCVCLSSDRMGTYVHKLSVASSYPGLEPCPLATANCCSGGSKYWEGPARVDQASWLGALCIISCRCV